MKASADFIIRSCQGRFAAKVLRRDWVGSVTGFVQPSVERDYPWHTEADRTRTRCIPGKYFAVQRQGTGLAVLVQIVTEHAAAVKARQTAKAAPTD